MGVVVGFYTIKKIEKKLYTHKIYIYSKRPYDTSGALEFPSI